MARFLIEVSHENHLMACLQAVRTLFSTGSHFLTHADWGCSDGEHKAWVIVELDNKEAAKAILPPDYRSTAKIVELKKFTQLDVNEMDRQLQNKSAQKTL